MPKYLLLAASLALASCAAQKALPQYTPEQQAAQRGGISYWQPDSTKAVPKLSPVAQAKLEARRRRGQAPAPLASDGGVRLLDSTVAIPYTTPQPGRGAAFWQKVNPFRSKQPQVADSQEPAKRVEASLPRKCKGCTFNVVAGNQTVAGKKAQVAAGDGAAVVVAEKKAGPVVLADSGAKVQVATAKKGQAAAGEGNTQTAPKAGFPWWIVLVGAGLYVGYKKFIA